MASPPRLYISDNASGDEWFIVRRIESGRRGAPVTDADDPELRSLRRAHRTIIQVDLPSPSTVEKEQLAPPKRQDPPPRTPQDPLP